MIKLFAMRAQALRGTGQRRAVTPPGFLLAACGLQTVPGGFHPYGAGLLLICDASREKVLCLCVWILEIETVTEKVSWGLWGESMVLGPRPCLLLLTKQGTFPLHTLGA